MIAAIAAHRMPLSQAEPYLDHLTSCSPCYRDFLQLQAQYRQRRARIIFAVAASVLIVVGLATWAMVHNRDLEITRARVDLRERSIARGGDGTSTSPPIPISRHASELEIALPLGSTDGPYEIRISTEDGKAVFTKVATAVTREGVTTVDIQINLSKISKDANLLAIRRSGDSWKSFKIVLQ